MANAELIKRVISDLEHGKISRTLAASDLRRAIDEPHFAAKVVTPGGSIECPHCHWGIDPNSIQQHIREKH